MEIGKNLKYKLFFYFIISVLFGVVFLLTPIYKQNNTDSLCLLRLPTGICMYMLCMICLDWITERPFFFKKYAEKKFKRTYLYMCFLLILFVGLIYLLVYYPGTGMYDTLAILSSSGFGIAKQHPWLYVLLTQAIVKIVFVFGGDYEIALVTLSLLQIFLTASVYTYLVYWLQKKGISKTILLGIICVYSLTPFLGITMVNIFKDIPFSLLITLWVPFLYDFWEKKGECLTNKRIIFRLGILIFFSLLRNNGIYIVTIILFCMFIVYPERWRKYILLFGFLVMTIIGSQAFEKHHNINHLFKETVGIPLQQMAGVVYYDGEISMEQKNFIEKIIPCEFIKENYNPYSADKLKWGGAPLDNSFLNSNKKEFIKTWAKMLIPNLNIYIDTYLRNTYGFWSLTNEPRNQKFTTIYVESWKEWLEENDISIKQILPEEVQNRLEPKLTELSFFWGSGTTFWLFIMMITIFIYRNGWKSSIVAAPILGGWGTIMISTPIAYQARYTLYIVMVLPLILGMLFLSRRKENTNE